MRTLLIILSFSFLFFSCGKDNTQTEIRYVTDNSQASTTYPYSYCGSINIAWGGSNPYILKADTGGNYTLMQRNKTVYDQLANYSQSQVCIYSSTAASNGQVYVDYIGSYQSTVQPTPTSTPGSGTGTCNCPTAYPNDAVCGSNNMTYPSACHAQCAGVSVRSYGSCPWMMGI